MAHCLWRHPEVTLAALLASSFHFIHSSGESRSRAAIDHLLAEGQHGAVGHRERLV